MMSQSDRRVHFGLGKATRVERLEVRWANGPTVAYEVPGVDREIVIHQTSGLVTPRDSGRPGPEGPASAETADPSAPGSAAAPRDDGGQGR